jgi:hypothetical protein
MANATRFVGLDVHARETARAVFEPGTGEVQTRKIRGRPDAVVGWLETLERPCQAVYEAGPAGYGWPAGRRARTRCSVCGWVCCWGACSQRAWAGSGCSGSTSRSV